jgi:hypothetical protein
MQFKRKFVNYLEMKNSLQNLTETLQKFEIGKVSLQEMAKEFVRFFEQLHSQAEKGANKEEMATKAVEALQQLAGVIQPYIDVIPLGEDNLLASLDNPSYFDADEWKSAQEAKERLGELVRQLLTHLATVPQLEESQETLKKDKKQPPRASKSQWMKS